ncbi:MAG TPA: serine protease, partial [Sphingobium sp.]|nr:serine protease [Sphingobium sp.]
MKTLGSLIVAGLLLTGPAAQAQLLPSPNGALGQVGGVVPDLLNDAEGALDRVPSTRLAERLVAERAARIGDLLRRHGDSVELDDRKEVARRGVILLTGARQASIEALRDAGYGVASDAIEGIDLPLTRVTVPSGRSLSRALKQVRSIAPEAEASADNLYFPGGTAPKSAIAALA